MKKRIVLGALSVFVMVYLCACEADFLAGTDKDMIVGTWICDLAILDGSYYDRSKVDIDIGFTAKSDGTCAIHFYSDACELNSNLECVWEFLAVDEDKCNVYTISVLKIDGIKVEVASVKVDKEDELLFEGSGSSGVFDSTVLYCTRIKSQN